MQRLANSHELSIIALWIYAYDVGRYLCRNEEKEEQRGDLGQLLRLVEFKVSLQQTGNLFRRFSSRNARLSVAYVSSVYDILMFLSEQKRAVEAGNERITMLLAWEFH